MRGAHRGWPGPLTQSCWPLRHSVASRCSSCREIAPVARRAPRACTGFGARHRRVSVHAAALPARSAKASARRPTSDRQAVWGTTVSPPADAARARAVTDLRRKTVTPRTQGAARANGRGSPSACRDANRSRLSSPLSPCRARLATRFGEGCGWEARKPRPLPLEAPMRAMVYRGPYQVRVEEKDGPGSSTRTTRSCG